MRQLSLDKILRVRNFCVFFAELNRPNQQQRSVRNNTLMTTKLPNIKETRSVLNEARLVYVRLGGVAHPPSLPPSVHDTFESHTTRSVPATVDVFIVCNPNGTP